jgi:cholesterol oxidase
MSDDNLMVWFTEEMRGFITLGEEDYEQGYAKGQQADTSCMFRLTITIPDVELFVRDPAETGSAAGYVQCPALGGKLPVEQGLFNCFVDVGEPDQNVKQMRYRLFCRDTTGRTLTLHGHKIVKDDGVLDIWRDTTTLYTRILAGHVESPDDPAAEVIAAGILTIPLADFAHQLTTFRAHGPTVADRERAIMLFTRTFLGSLWEVYAPRFHLGADNLGNKREIPLYTLEGVKDAEITTYHLTTGDKLGLNLLRFLRAPCDDVVVLLHGLSTSTDMFIMPEQYNLVSYLLDHGYTDVWGFDWRGSMRYNYDLFPSRFTLDDIALYDHPAAIDLVRRTVGADKRLHVICHCVGSITFMMSLAAGLIEGVSSVISNSVSLTPRVPRWSAVKLAIAPFFLLWILRFPNLNPRWSMLPGPGIPQGKLLAKLVSLTHPECDVPACHMISFMWGSGRPACYEHVNLADVTHRRVGDLFGAVDIGYDLHIRKMVRHGAAVKMYPHEARYNQLPNNYLEQAASITIPILFVTGDTNRVFRDSNVITYNALRTLNNGNANELRILPGYGHQDPFMGKHNDRDVFPHLIAFLDTHRAPASR